MNLPQKSWAPPSMLAHNYFWNFSTHIISGSDLTFPRAFPGLHSYHKPSATQSLEEGVCLFLSRSKAYLSSPGITANPFLQVPCPQVCVHRLPELRHAHQRSHKKILMAGIATSNPDSCGPWQQRGCQGLKGSPLFFFLQSEESLGKFILVPPVYAQSFKASGQQNTHRTHKNNFCEVSRGNVFLAQLI